MNIHERIDQLLDQEAEFPEVIEVIMSEYGFNYDNAVLIYEEEH